MTSIPTPAVNATDGLRNLLMTWSVEDLVRAATDERERYAAEVLILMEEELTRRGIGAEEYEQILYRADQHNAVIQAAQDSNGWVTWTATSDLRQLFSVFL